MSTSQRPRDEDLFADSTMSFGDHLEELRSCLVKALLGLLVGFIIGLIFGDYIVGLIKLPLEEGLQGYYQKRAATEYNEFAAQRKSKGLPIPYDVKDVEAFINNDYIFTMFQVHPRAVRIQLGLEEPPAAATTPPTDSKSSDADESAEKEPQGAAPPPIDLKKGLVPLFVWSKIEEDQRVSVKALHPSEVFMIWLKASLVAGVVISSPWIFYQLWTFVAAGLYPSERKYVHIFLPFSVILFLSGAFFCFFIVFPFILDFLFKFNARLGIDPDPRISEWLSFAIFLPVGFGISFQLPLVMLFLERIGIFDVPAYISKWRLAVLVIFIIAMLLTPADPMSMLAMAIPLTALYFGGIALCHYFPKSKGIMDE